MGETLPLLPRTLAAVIALTAGMVTNLVVDSLVIWMAGSSLHGCLVADLASLLVAIDVREATYEKLR
jgi:hypothetical protein